MQPFDLGRELGRLVGQLPRELQRRAGDLSVDHGDGYRHRAARDVEDRRVILVGAQVRLPVLAHVYADVSGRPAAAFHAASLISGPGRPRPGERMPAALSE